MQARLRQAQDLGFLKEGGGGGSLYEVKRQRFDHVSSVKSFDDATSLFLSFGCNCNPIRNELSKFRIGIVRFRTF